MGEACCETHGHVFGYQDACIFCAEPKPPLDLSKDAICEFVRVKRDVASGDERRYLAAVYFVLRNRTKENWGPEELDMRTAMRIL